MYRNFLNGNNEKISKVIELAVSYKNHRKSLQRIKPAIGMPSLNNIKKVDQLTTNRIRYAKESRTFRQSHIQRQNQSNSKRVLNASSQYTKLRNPELISSPPKGSQLQKSKSKSRLSSRQSLHSCDSQRSICSNFMTRTRRHKQIEQQNKKIASRITNPKTNKNMKFKELDKEYMKQQEYMRIRSRFSQRSKSIMQSLMLDGLKMDKKNLQFLPQINTSRNYETIGNSRTSLIDNQKAQSEKRLKTLSFAHNMRKQLRKSSQAQH